MKTAVAALLTLAAGASAFTSTQPSSSSTTLRAAKEYAGAFDLRGKEFKFDPVSLILGYILPP
jgi:hypothetical protein